MTVEPTTLQLVWFCLIAVLWIGFLVLEGFDYGVGMLIRFLGRSDKEKRVMINTIGPLWDGNEVWLLTAGGATFAAFPGWYATLFSGLYLPLFLVLAGLIIRGVAFEYRAKHPTTRWRNAFDWMGAIGFACGVGVGRTGAGVLVGAALCVNAGEGDPTETTGSARLQPVANASESSASSTEHMRLSVRIRCFMRSPPFVSTKVYRNGLNEL